ncbi:MAG: MFS transporter, partial [bacterium]
VIANPQSWACAGIGFGMTAIMLAFAGLWAVPWLINVHAYPVAAAAGVVSTLFFGWALAAPAMGWLSDHIGRRKPVLLVGVLCNTAIFLLLLLATPATPLAMSALFFALGVSGSMMTIAFGSMREVNAPQHSATAMGLVNMCVVGSGAVMQPLIGWLLDLGWDGRIVDGARVYAAADYTAAFSVLVGSNLLALGCVALLRETYCRPLSEQSSAQAAVAD